jgi:aspartate 1-decarboxylase
MRGKIVPLLLLLPLIISLIVCTGCSNQSGKYNYINYKELKRPNNKVKLHSTVVNTYEIYYPGSITIINNYLLFIDHKADKIIKINDLKSYKLLKSFGRLGQGPSEFIGASQIIPVQKDKNIFWIYDISKQELKKFNINKVLNNESNPEKIISMKGGNGTPTQLIFTPDNKILGIGFFFKGRISIYNMSGDFIRSVGKIPVILKNERFASQHSHGFTGKFILKNKSKEIFIATRHGAVVEKYNIENGKLISTFYGPDSFFPEYKIVPAGEYYTMTYNKKTRFGYLDICYNKKLDRLFLLYSGEYQYNKENKKANSSNIVYVLDNKGTIIEEIELDKEIFQMTISDDGSTIFGHTESEILKFEYNNKLT